MSAGYLYPFILLAGLLQAAGASMNGQLFKALPNPWMASAVSFGLILVFFLAMSCVQPRPLPTAEGLEGMPWWAPLGGLVGAMAVYAGLVFVTKVGAGPLNGMTITANILASIAIDHFGLLRMDVHELTWQRAAGAALMVGGVALVARVLRRETAEGRRPSPHSSAAACSGFGPLSWPLADTSRSTSSITAMSAASP